MGVGCKKTKLRTDVKWHDGKPFTGKDVACTAKNPTTCAAIGAGDPVVQREEARKIMGPTTSPRSKWRGVTSARSAPAVILVDQLNKIISTSSST